MPPSAGPTSPLPPFVYKILPSAPPTPLPSPYPLSDLDKQDGFVHLSTASQIPTTAGIFFKDNTELWILKIRLDHFPNDIDWTIPGCPHLFGNFGAEDVASTQKFTRTEGLDWRQVFDADSAWLE